MKEFKQDDSKNMKKVDNSQNKLDKENAKNMYENSEEANAFKNVDLLEMDETDIENMAKTRIKNMAKEEVEKLGKQQKLMFRSIIILTFIAGIIFFGIGVYGIIIHLDVWIVTFFMALILFVIGASLTYKFKKYTIEDWAVLYSKNEIKKVQSAAKKSDKIVEDLTTLNGKPIRKTKIIDSHTEYSDKLHAILNYQEIIQHIIYKFVVYFEDGTTQVVNAEEGTKLYNKLISFLDIGGNDAKEGHTYSSADEIKKYKQLLEDEIITQEEFEEKKKELLKNKFES